jgi:hypothetical protein
MVLGLVSYAQYRGLSLDKVNELKDVPKSVRDNPGAYRSHYGYLPRYIGGK